MKFYSSSDKSGIVDDTWFIVFGDSGDHSADYPLADIARNANAWEDRVLSKILQADHRFKFDDYNQTDLPIADISIVAGQYDYGISGATYLKISRIELYDSAGNTILLDNFGEDDVRSQALKIGQLQTGTPSGYMLRGNSFFLDKKPDQAYTARVFYQRAMSHFTSADTTKEPGFAPQFHRIISLGCARDYVAFKAGMEDKLVEIDRELYGDARKEKPGLFDELKEFYASRNDNKISLSLAKSDHGQSALASESVNPQNGFIM